MSTVKRRIYGLRDIESKLNARCRDIKVNTVYSFATVVGLRDGNGSVGHGSNGSPFLDGSRVTAIDP